MSNFNKCVLSIPESVVNCVSLLSPGYITQKGEHD